MHTCVLMQRCRSNNTPLVIYSYVTLWVTSVLILHRFNRSFLEFLYIHSFIFYSFENTHYKEGFNFYVICVLIF